MKRIIRVSMVVVQKNGDDGIRYVMDVKLPKFKREYTSDDEEFNDKKFSEYCDRIEEKIRQSLKSLKLPKKRRKPFKQGKLQ